MCLVLAGCSGSAGRPDLYPVSGTVLYNGKPVENATVSFLADGAPRAATGVTDAEGKYQLTTFDLNDGAVAGTHKITVTKMEAGATAGGMTKEEENKLLNDPTALAGQMSQGTENKAPKSLIPEKYASVETSGLSEEVKAGSENTFVLQLSD